MKYYFEKLVDGPFDEVVGKVREALAREGFGVLTEIDVQATMKKKLNVDFPRYLILGACNPPFAHKALLVENKIGAMLPCNVVVQEMIDGKVEIAAVDPVASMQAIENQGLADIAGEIRGKLQRTVESL
ncbi:MAG TPA: DUF302 domain-containing protein [Spirochaetia bacterium]|nr:DUF302 domain-containing protein [Spirochaetia bacterium]